MFVDKSAPVFEEPTFTAPTTEIEVEYESKRDLLFIICRL